MQRFQVMDESREQNKCTTVRSLDHHKINRIRTTTYLKKEHHYHVKEKLCYITWVASCVIRLPQILGGNDKLLSEILNNPLILIFNPILIRSYFKSLKAFPQYYASACITTGVGDCRFCQEITAPLKQPSVAH